MRLIWPGSDPGQDAVRVLVLIAGIRGSTVRIAIATAMFLLLGVLFLDHLLELVRFLAQLHEGLLCGTGFLSAFLSGAEIGFLRSVFLKTTTIARVVHRARAPMLIARSQSFSVRAFWDCGQYQVATYLF